MPQQINLRTPILLTQRRYFSAGTMAWALGVIGAFSLALCVYWVWSLEASNAELQRTLGRHATERERLLAAIREQGSSPLPPDADLGPVLQARQAQLQQRERLLAELGRGLLRDGQGHAGRLRLVAQTIPAEVWVTEVLADEQQMEVTGFTFEPAALNLWVARLGAHPLLKGHVLSTVKVERVPAGVARPAGASGGAGAPPRWAFTLVSRAGGRS